MSFIQSLNVAGAGLSAQRTRMNVIAENLANINTTRTAEGGPYLRKDVVLAAVPEGKPFKDVLKEQGLGPGAEASLSTVTVAEVIEDPRPPRIVYDPNHPDADEAGYVQMPNINVVEEMVNMISAHRSYDANVTAAETTRKMALRALDIGR